MTSTVTIDFNAQLSRFSSAIDKATSDLNKFQTNTARISANINKTFGSLGIGLSAAGFASFLKGTIDSLDKLNDLSKSTGLAVEQLAGLQLAAEQSGSDLESVAQSINKLSVNIGQNSEKFKDLGITAKEPLEAFKQLSDIYNAIDDPQKRAAFAAEALGKAWQGAAPLLAEGSKSIGLMVNNGTKLSGVTKEVVDQADKFNDQLAEMSVRAKAVSLPLISALSRFSTQFEEASKQTDIFSAALERLKLAAKFSNPALTAFSIFNGDDGSGQAASGVIKKRTQALGADAVKKIDAFISSNGNSGKGSTALRQKFDQDAETARRFIESLTKEVETLGLSETALRRYEAAHLKLTPAQKEVFDGAIKKVEAFNEEQKRLEALNQAYEDHQRVIEDFNNRELDFLENQSAEEVDREEQFKREAQAIREMLDPTIKLYNEIAKVQSLQNLGLLDQEEADAAIKELEDRYESANKIANETVNVAKELGLTFSSAFEDAIVGGKNFQEILSGIEQDILRIVTRKLVTEPAAEALTGLLKGFDFSALFNANGNAFGSSGLIPFANGGIVSSATPFAFGGGQLGVMGEAGPEAILPLRRGPDGKLGVQGGAINIQGPLMVVNTPDASSFNKSGPQIAADMHRALARGRRVM